MTDFTLPYNQKATIESTVINLQTAGGLDDFAHLIFTVKSDLSNTDASALIQKKATQGGSADLQIKTAGSGPSPSVNGILWITLHTADYATITPGIESTLEWDLVALDSDGEEYPLDSGKLKVTPHATQATS